jgi:hypothetical protein
VIAAWHSLQHQQFHALSLPMPPLPPAKASQSHPSAPEPPQHIHVLVPLPAGPARLKTHVWFHCLQVNRSTFVRVDYSGDLEQAVNGQIE